MRRCINITFSNEMKKAFYFSGFLPPNPSSNSQVSVRQTLHLQTYGSIEHLTNLLQNYKGNKNLTSLWTGQIVQWVRHLPYSLQSLPGVIPQCTQPVITSGHHWVLPKSHLVSPQNCQSWETHKLGETWGKGPINEIRISELGNKKEFIVKMVELNGVKYISNYVLQIFFYF